MRLDYSDTETTGLSPAGRPHWVEIAAVEMLDWQLTGTGKFHHLLNPEHPISEEVMAEIIDHLMAAVAGKPIICGYAQVSIDFCWEQLCSPCRI